MNFVAIDLNQKLSKEQREIVDKYFAGYIPHLVILDKNGKAVYNQSGEREEEKISAMLDKLLDDRSSIH